MSIVRMWLSVGVVAVCSGCFVTFDEYDRNNVRQRMEIVSLQRDMRLIDTRLQEMDAARESVYKQIDDLRSENVKDRRDTAKGLTELIRAIDALASADKVMRKEIIDQLNKTIDKTVKEAAVQPDPKEHGRIHVVKRGQTLSEIAEAYKVSEKVIMKANKIANADMIKEGSELFIPE